MFDEGRCGILGDFDARTIAYREWYDSCSASLMRYRQILSALNIQMATIGDPTSRRKQVRETARSVLPNCTETKIFATANVRALRHFIELRGSLHADAEIRRLAVVMLRVVSAEAPDLFRDFSIAADPEGREYATCTYHKV